MSCYVCGSNLALEEHHLTQQAHAGTSGRTVMLCATCHDLAHKEARLLTSKSRKTKSYIPANLASRMNKIVQAIISGLLDYNTKKDALQDHALQELRIEVSPRQLQRLHILKQYHGYTSLEAFMLAVVEKLTSAKSVPKGTPTASDLEDLIRPRS